MRSSPLSGLESSCKGVVGDKAAEGCRAALRWKLWIPWEMAQLGPGRDLPWGVAVTELFPAAVLHILAPTQKGRMSDTSNNFCYKPNHWEITAWLTLIPLSLWSCYWKCNFFFFILNPLTFQSRAWVMWNKSRSGPAFIHKLSITVNSTRN